MFVQFKGRRTTNMSKGRLTEENMDDIEKMIGEGRKRFTLLYSIARDACDSDIFHQRCDNKGPTVTMLYNPKGSVFGFYTGIDWKSEGGWEKDTKNFLIQLSYFGNKRYTKCLTKNSSAVIFGNKRYGPWSEAINCFSGKTLAPCNGVFTLNGNMDSFTSDSYDTCGLSPSDVNNGSMEVIDLEVYSVADGKRSPKHDIECPWRTQPQWNPEYVSQLSEELSAIEITTKPRLLLLGTIGAGKSSFVNTVASALAGRMVHLASCGTDRHAATSTRSQGIDIHELHFLLDGNVPENYDFNPTQSLSLKSPDFVFNPKAGDLVHCVAIVVDATAVDDMSGETQEQLNNFKHVIFKKRIPLAVLLTKVDEVSNNVQKKLDDIFMSTDVAKLVNKTAKLLGVPRNVVFPIKNYEHEMEPVDSVNSLALFALKRMVEMATDQLAKSHFAEGAERSGDIDPKATNMSDTA
ncbi:IFI44-like protein [Mya arenaria]|uniref:IFI44-like protein n=1 Tax=Mya arenaria TaxID=6604 RepID=A0ABY7DM96_MYAAR|nr:IFI44-like protein [Mya arenaria]